MAQVDGVSNKLIGTWKVVSVQFEDIQGSRARAWTIS